MECSFQLAAGMAGRKGRTMKKFVSSIAAFALAASLNTGAMPEFTGFAASEAVACPKGYVKKQKNCEPIKAPGIRFKGNAKPKTIQITICHRTWNKLNGDPAKGERWWGMTIKTGEWQANIREVHEKCTKQNVVAGSQIGNKHNCRTPYWKWYWSEPLTVAGETYWVG